jgi:hypothetical protein
MRNDYTQRPRPGFKMGGKVKKNGKGFPDLTGDGKVTFKDILKGRGVIKKKGGMIMDESMAHENMESMKMEAQETKMERKGFKETKSGKMTKKGKK